MLRDLRLEISVVNKGFIDISGRGGLKSGTCNIDVICSEGDDWRDQIRAVARYTISGTGLCTGTLMNNTSFDATSDFLSANHCGVKRVTTTRWCSTGTSIRRTAATRAVVT